MVVFFSHRLCYKELERESIKKKIKKADFVFFTGTGVLTLISSSIAQNFQGWMWCLKTDPLHIT